MTERAPHPRPQTIVALAAALIAALGGAAACQKDDAGACCRPISPDAAVPPEAEQGTTDGGIPKDKIAQHPLFDCERLVCTSYEGSEAFCTKECDDKRPCPEGLACELIVTSSASAMPTFSPSQRWCVRPRCGEGLTPCAEGFTCVADGVGVLKHCVRDEQRCAQ